MPKTKSLAHNIERDRDLGQLTEYCSDSLFRNGVQCSLFANLEHIKKRNSARFKGRARIVTLLILIEGGMSLILVPLVQSSRG